MTKPTGILSLPHFNDNLFRWPALAHRYQNVSILDVTGADADGGSGDNWSYSTCKKKISHRHYIGPLRGSSSLFSTLSRRGLNTIKPVYDPDWSDGRLNLTASVFNKLGCSKRNFSRSIPAVLVAGATATQNLPFSSLSVVVTIASTHCAYPRLSWPGWLVT